MGFVCGLFLLLTLPALALTEVVASFSVCPDFFWKDQNGRPVTPTIFTEVDPQRGHDRYQKICQRYSNHYQFATLYDTTSKIPVYSAYNFTSIQKCSRKSNWFIEPKLDDNNGDPNMKNEKDVQNLGANQAINNDYVKSGYDKGHLYPVSQADDQCTAYSTFTLTNAAPQHPHSNRGVWNQMERAVLNYMTTNCQLDNNKIAYIMTGTVPSNPSSLMNRRVNIPAYYWNAFCCFDKKSKKWMSKAHVGPNDSSGTLQELCLVNLETKLAQDYEVAADVTTNHPAVRTPTTNAQIKAIQKYCERKQGEKVFFWSSVQGLPACFITHNTAVMSVNSSHLHCHSCDQHRHQGDENTTRSLQRDYTLAQYLVRVKEPKQTDPEQPLLLSLTDRAGLANNPSPRQRVHHPRLRL
ncbi:ENDD1 protein, partial [Polyodon spathula]|nr:ENDD1 protein [Polyodon spathula]